MSFRLITHDDETGLTNGGASADSAPAISPDTPCVVVIGAFDGVHKGHRRLIADAAADARHRGVPAVVVTFDPDPADVLFGVKPLTRLTERDDRVRLLLEAGADAVACFDFTEELERTGWREFALQVLGAVCRPVSVHIGSNFRFGAQGAGTPALLADLGRECGFEVSEHELVVCDGDVVSATRVRGLIRSGDVREAARLLERSHFVRGQVLHGRGEGMGFGFATANVQVDSAICMPGEGVYGGWAIVGEAAWPAAVNVGAPRTFTDSVDDSFLEAHLLGFEGDLYGRDVAIVFSQWLRAARRFESTAELERVVGNNINWVQMYLGTGRTDAATALRPYTGPGEVRA